MPHSLRTSDEGVYSYIEVDEQRLVNVRFTPESGLQTAVAECPLRAKKQTFAPTSVITDGSLKNAIARRKEAKMM